MTKHLFKLLFGALFLVAATAFTGCSDDDDKTSTPELTASPEALSFTDETETTQTVTISANCEWTVEKSNLDWATITPMSGKGDATLTVSVSELPAGTASRTGTISFSMIHSEFGKWGTAESKVAVTQTSGSDIPSGDAIYTNNFDKETATATYGTGTSWPYLDQFEGWQNQSGTGAEAVTYTYSGVSARANSTSNSSYSDYSGSGNNNIFFGANGVLTIEKIAVAAKNLKLTFGAERYSQSAGSDFIHDDFQVQLSNDGSAWSDPITYTFAKGTDPSGRWDLATADFTLPDNTTSLYVRYTSKVASVHRLDDVTLAEGLGGQQITFNGGDTPSGDAVLTTIPELIAKCEAAGSTQTVIDETKDYYFDAVVVTDKDGGNTTSNNLVVMTEGATTAKNGITLYGSGIYTNPADDGFTFKAGDKVKVTLKAGAARVTTYSSLYEITGSKDAEWVLVEKTGTTTISPIAIDVADMLSYQAMPVTISNVTAPASAAAWCTAEAAGTHTFTAGGANLTVYVQKNAAAFVDQQFTAGATGSISGAVALYKGAVQLAPRTIADVADFMNASPSPDPKISAVNPASLSFAAAGEAKDVTVTLNSAAAGLAIEATADNAQFTTSVNGTTVSVTAAENTATTAITGTLTVKLMKDGAAVDTKTVALSQAGKSEGPSGDETTVTMDVSAIETGKTGGYGLFENSYQSKDDKEVQSLTDALTWYQWSANGADFAGYHICKATADDYVGMLQMQGNASDVAKQGFFGNTTDLGKISKIVVVSKNTKYDPTEHLYMGTAANPKENAQTSTFTQEGQIYTETFEISGDYGYFTLANDKQGAFYVQSISITYTK